jgi:hypothetical protein
MMGRLQPEFNAGGKGRLMNNPDGAESKDQAAAPERPRRTLSAAAKRALAEAESRRKSAAETEPMPVEIGGRGGREPVRYGDWEIKGRAIDF